MLLAQIILSGIAAGAIFALSRWICSDVQRKHTSSISDGALASAACTEFRIAQVCLLFPSELKTQWPSDALQPSRTAGRHARGLPHRRW
jgi:hypothetical protein